MKGGNILNFRRVHRLLPVSKKLLWRFLILGFEDLKSRGFENAGLYDPPGVSGTHVMYVLHHADKPSIYAGLPDKPQISAFVGLWKGIIKPVALAGIAFTVLAGFFHWIVAGPNEVQPEDEAEAQRLLHPADERR